MADKMLIDASHEEETRVVVVRGNRIEEFDFESQHKKQLRGNIYLAKVTRVEPSLQAAFIDYGGNRHGFLAFSEIHPDYYQIPLADRQALLAAEAEAEAERARHENDEDDEEEADADESDDRSEEKSASSRSRNKQRRGRGRKRSGSDDGDDDHDSDQVSTINDEMAAIVEGDEISEELGADKTRDPGEIDVEAANHVEGKAESALPASDDADTQAAVVEEASSADDAHEDEAPRQDTRPQRGRSGRDEEPAERVESVGAEDALEELPERSVSRKPRKQYRIQEVIKRRQILLVQVVKEERGNKGAALTTYLSLAGRYSVLMPNTARGGGISRKITNVQDRKRLKEIARGLEVPQGMGVILRTAGANRTKAEIKRDFEYLMRLWENVRNLTLSSTAPTLTYEEGSLIKRSIRDLYNKDISEIVVSGEEGYREAKDFMKMLMPSHAKVVQPYREIHPIFARSGIEAQLDRMLQPQVTLKSGGYIIINQTEALVAIDVNSGRSTKEHSIEDTALQTNLEAADEVARQLRLRDLAGLIVVDFIDMEEKRNNRSVEKRMKDALKNDRARIQVGRISHFGLLEMSRQRIRASVLELTTQVCEHCGGTGHVRSQSSVALHVLRSIEEFLLKSTTHDITVRMMPSTALYVLNQKRDTIVEMERRFGVSIIVEADATIGSQHLAIDRGAAVETPVKIETLVPTITYEDEDDDGIAPSFDDEEDEAEDDQPAVQAHVAGETQKSEQPSQQRNGNGDADADGQRKRKRRRRRRGGRDGAEGRTGEHDAQTGDGQADDNDDEHGSDDDDRDDAQTEGHVEGAAVAGDDDRPKKRRRRGKRGGRRNRGLEDGVEAASNGDGDHSASGPASGDDEDGDDDRAAAADVEETVATAPEEAVAEAVEALDDAPAEAGEEKPKKKRATRKKKDAEPAAEVEAEVEEAPAPAKVRKPRASRAKAAKTVAVADDAAMPAEAESAAIVEDAAPAAVEIAQPELAKSEPAKSEPVMSEPAKAEAVTAEPKISSTAKAAEETESDKPKKGGWWQRRGFF